MSEKISMIIDVGSTVIYLVAITTCIYVMWLGNKRDKESIKFLLQYHEWMQELITERISQLKVNKSITKFLELEKIHKKETEERIKALEKKIKDNGIV